MPITKNGVAICKEVVIPNRDLIAKDSIIKERAIKRKELLTKLQKQSLSLEDNPAKLVDEYLRREDDLHNANFVVFANDLWLLGKKCPDKLFMFFM